MPKKKFKVTIAWGSSSTREENEDGETTYEFDTQAELDAFLKGVDEACGWSDYEVME